MSWEEVMDGGGGQTMVPTKSIAVRSVSSGYRGEMRRDEVGGRKKETEDIGICG